MIKTRVNLHIFFVRTFPYPITDTINTIHTKSQSTVTPQKRKVPIPVQWSTDEIKSVYKTHGSAYGINQQTGRNAKAALLQQHFVKFKGMSYDDICICLENMRRNKRKSVHQTTYEPIPENTIEAQMDRVAALKTLNNRLKDVCQNLKSQFEAKQKDIRAQQLVIQQKEQKVSQLRSSLAIQREEFRKQTQRIETQCNQKMLNLRSECKQNLVNARSQCNQSIHSVHNQYSEKMEKIRAECQQQIQSIREQCHFNLQHQMDGITQKNEVKVADFENQIRKLQGK